MVTKYIVKDNSIEFYENDDVILTLPNTKDNLKLAKLYNNQVFIDKDIVDAKTISDYYHDISQKSAITSLTVFILLVVSNLFNVGGLSFICSYATLFNVIVFMINNSHYKKSIRKLDYLNNIKKKINNEIEEIKNSNNKEKEDNQQLTFTNEQIISDHRDWVTSMGNEYDYNNDIDTINNTKILIKR